MEDPITAFVEHSRQLLVEFAKGSHRLEPKPGDAPGAAQNHFVADFTRLIEDFLDSLRDRGIAVGALLATQLLECCAQMRRLADGAQQQDSALAERGAVLRQRLEKLIESAEPAVQREGWRQDQAMTY